LSAMPDSLAHAMVSSILVLSAGCCTHRVMGSCGAGLGRERWVEKLRAARAGRAALPESGAESKHAVDVGRGHLGVHCCWQTPKIIMGHTPRPQQLCDLFHSSPSRILPG
jgi:hypothetical protein